MISHYEHTYTFLLTINTVYIKNDPLEWTRIIMFLSAELKPTLPKKYDVGYLIASWSIIDLLLQSKMFIETPNIGELGPLNDI